METKYGIKHFEVYNCIPEDIDLLSKDSTEILSRHIIEKVLSETKNNINDNETVGLMVIVHHYPFKQCQFLSTTLEALKENVNKEFNSIKNK